MTSETPNEQPRANWLSTLATYAVMVGIPLAALFWVVRSGAALEAPAAIGGEWVLEGDDAQACFAIEQLSVSQSGRYLSIETHGVTREARLEGERFTFELDAPGGTCVGESVRVEASSGEDHLAVTLLAPRCAERCRTLPLMAHHPAD
jgi:hypothetical protein